jgi:drug/metabolite transporter (DMT)-like permease
VSAPNAPVDRSGLAVGTACYLFAAIFWGMNVPMTAELFRWFDPFFMIPLRIGIGMLLLAAIAVAMYGTGALRLGTSVPRLGTMSLAMATFFTLYNVGLKYTHPVTAAALMAGSPVYAAVTMRLFARAPLERGFWGGAALTLLGGLIAVWGQASGSGAGLELRGGEPMIVLGYVGWTLYSIYAQRWFDPAVPQLQRTYAASLGAVFWLAVSWVVMRATGIAGPAVFPMEVRPVVLLLATALLSSSLAILAWNIGVSRVGLLAGMLWQNTVPVFAVLIAMLFGIFPTPEQAIGGAIVMAGVLYMQWRKFRG